MKTVRAFLLVVIALSFAVAAAADSAPDIRIIFDPIPNSPVQLTDIISIGAPVTVGWQSCSNLGIPSSVSGETACLALANLTGQVISSLDLQFTAPAVIAGQVVDCQNADSYLTSNNCPAGTLVAGQLIDITFRGGNPVPNDVDVFFGVDAPGLTDPSQLSPAGVTATPEPATVALFSSGLLIMGFAWMWRRRANLNAKTTA